MVGGYSQSKYLKAKIKEINLLKKQKKFYQYKEENKQVEEK
jgi:hypothetical protein